MKKKVLTKTSKNHNKKKIIIIIVIVLIILLLSLLATFLYYQKINNEKDEVLKELAKTIENSFLEYDNSIEYGESWTYDDFLNNLLSKDIVNSSIKIEINIDKNKIDKKSTYDFMKIGENKVIINLSDSYTYKIFKKHTKTVSAKKEIKLLVEDSKFPVIEGVKNLVITVGDKLDFSSIKANDEIDGELEVIIEGEVDSNKVGSYNLKAIATDKNDNKTEKDFKITVKAKNVVNNNNNNSNNKSDNNNSNSCSSASLLKKRGYSNNDTNACEKDKQASTIAKQIANSILSKGYQTDLEKVQAAAQQVSGYYVRESHVEEGLDYRTPYGLFVLHSASCAGCTRALIQVLEYMGYTNLTHANANSWTHQWVIINMDGQVGYADGQVGWVGYGNHPIAD